MGSYIRALTGALYDDGGRSGNECAPRVSRPGKLTQGVVVSACRVGNGVVGLQSPEVYSYLILAPKRQYLIIVPAREGPVNANKFSIRGLG